MAGSSESAFLFLDTKNGAIAPVVIIHLLLQQPHFLTIGILDIYWENAGIQKHRI
jgi:hypothetical protein